MTIFTRNFLEALKLINKAGMNFAILTRRLGSKNAVVISESNEYHLGRTRLILPLSGLVLRDKPFVLGKEAKGGCCSVVFVRLRYYYLEEKNKTSRGKSI